VLLFGSALLALNACAPDPVKFESNGWRNGDSVRRGAMSQKLVDSRVLLGRSREEVISLLGAPDRQDSRSLGYKIMPIARCHVWECRLDVTLNESAVVASAAVSD
jgi:hypothetical protein